MPVQLVTKHRERQSPLANRHSAPAKLPFPRPFQTRVLRLCLDSPEWSQYIKPSYFNHPLEVRVFRILQRMPQPASLKTLTLDCAREFGKLATRHVLRGVQKPLTEAERAYLLHELPRFVKFQTIGESLVQAGALYAKQDVDGLMRLREQLAQPLPDALGQLQLTPVSDVKMQAVTWKWKHRIAAGMLHLIGGDPGQGKSVLAVDLAARFSRGGPWPAGTAGSGKPEVVVILSAEDTTSHTIKPRLLAAGADLSKVFVRDVTVSGALSLTDALGPLEHELVNLKASVLIIDSVNDFLPRLDVHRMNEVKAVLQTWHTLAARLNIAIIGITHLSKAADRSAIQRFIGSVAFVAQARLAFLVVPDDKDLDRKRRLFVPVKNNLGPKAQSLGLLLHAVNVQADDIKVSAPKVTWMPIQRHIDPDALLRELHRGPRPKDVAAGILKRELHQGPVPVPTVIAALKAAGVKLKTARRVKDTLKIRSVQHAGCWHWGPPGWTDDQIKQHWRSKETSDGHKGDTERSGHLKRRRRRKSLINQV